MSTAVKRIKRKIKTQSGQQLEQEYKRYFVPAEYILYAPSVYFQQPSIYIPVPTVTTYGAYEEPI